MALIQASARKLTTTSLYAFPLGRQRYWYPSGPLKTRHSCQHVGSQWLGHHNVADSLTGDPATGRTRSAIGNVLYIRLSINTSVLDREQVNDADYVPYQSLHDRSYR